MNTRKLIRERVKHLELSTHASPSGQRIKFQGSTVKREASDLLGLKQETRNVKPLKTAFFKHAIIPIGCAIILLSVGEGLPFANGEVQISRDSGSTKPQFVTKKQSSEKTKRGSSFHLPVYKPPKGIGASGGRIGGGKPFAS